MYNGNGSKSSDFGLDRQFERKSLFGIPTNNFFEGSFERE